MNINTHEYGTDLLHILKHMILPMLLLTNHFVGLVRRWLGDHTRVYLARAGGPLQIGKHDGDGDEDDKDDHLQHDQDDKYDQWSRWHEW